MGNKDGTLPLVLAVAACTHHKRRAHSEAPLPYATTVQCDYIVNPKGCLPARAIGSENNSAYTAKCLLCWLNHSGGTPLAKEGIHGLPDLRLVASFHAWQSHDRAGDAYLLAILKQNLARSVVAREEQRSAKSLSHGVVLMSELACDEHPRPEIISMRCKFLQ